MLGTRDREFDYEKIGFLNENGQIWHLIYLTFDFNIK